MSIFDRDPNEPNILHGPAAALHLEAKERERVDVDTMIERPDLPGENACTFVAAGDEIPVGLEKLPRRPAHDSKRRTGRKAADVPGVA